MSTGDRLKHQIIFERADMTALLRYVNGGYILPVSYRVSYWCTSAFFVAVAVRVATTAEPIADQPARIVVSAFLLALAAVTASRATVSYSFSERAIERQSPLPFLRKTLAPDQISEGWLYLGKAVVLEFVTREGSRLKIPLEARLRNDLAKLYPEIGGDVELTAAVLPSRFRAVIWGAVAVITVAIVILAIVLTRAGLTEW